MTRLSQAEINASHAVYVDDAFVEGGWGMWTGGGHMQADSVDELHAFAARLGLKREWFQSRTGRPDRDHYDLTRSRRDKAILLGAIPEAVADGARRRRAIREALSAGNEPTTSPASPESPMNTGDAAAEQRNHNPKVPGSSPGSGIAEKPVLPGLSLFSLPPPVHDSRVSEGPSESGNDPRSDPKASESEVRDAILSEDRVYRYMLWRIWDKSRLPAVFIGLNPSTADEMADDPTIRRCVSYARAWGCGGIRMLNIFAFRATDPKAMRAAVSPVGPENDRTLRLFSAGAQVVVACWGSHGAHLDRGERVRSLLQWRDLRVFGLTQAGQPKHPLYLPKTQGLERWTDG